MSCASSSKWAATDATKGKGAAGGLCVDMQPSSQLTFPNLLLDLCCGGGAIGIEVARAASACGSGASRVLGVELCDSAVADARRNAALNGLLPAQYTVVHGSVQEVVDDLIAAASTSLNEEGAELSEANVIRPGAVAVLDPPRTGVAPSVCKALRAAQCIRRVIFISCNPHGHSLRHDFVVKGGSLSANTRILCGERGRGAPFQLARAVPVDLFPHTPHVELCLMFERMEAAPRSGKSRGRRSRAKSGTPES